MQRIEFKGKVIETEKDFSWVPDELCDELRREFYKKPPIDKVKKNLKNIFKGGVKVTDITNYFFKDLIAKVVFYDRRWSIEEVFENNDILKLCYCFTQGNTKFFPTTNPPIKNLETAFRVGCARATRKASNFPMKTIDSILQQYNINDVYYDYSCGWGVRMLSAMKNKIKYLGTDPNYILVDRLKELHSMYDNENNTVTEIDIRSHGSEIFVPEWEGKVGVIFSSPPYFGLEDYKIGNQSYQEGMSYEDWLEGYLRPTIRNSIRYLCEEGHFLINIKDYNKFPLVSDTIRICKEEGLELITSHTLNNITRHNSLGEKVDNNEDILVFKKCLTIIKHCDIIKI